MAAVDVVVVEVGVAVLVWCVRIVSLPPPRW